MSIKPFFKCHKEIILYLFLGGMTTLVNIVVYWLSRFFFGVGTSIVIAWCLAVLFAYITNKIYVFEAASKNAFGFIVELFLFFASRLTTGAMDFIGMKLLLSENSSRDYELIIKICLNILIVVINYVLSKFFVFRKK